MPEKNANTPYTLGLDVGIGSVSCSLLADDHIISLFISAFDIAELPKTGGSKNKVRSAAIHRRRTIRRRSGRLKKLRILFAERKLLCNSKSSSIIYSPTNSAPTPWHLRQKAIDNKVTPREWAQILYHMVNHRGYHSHSIRRSDQTETETGKVLKGISENQRLMSKKGYRSLAEMVTTDPKFKLAYRNKSKQYTCSFARADILAEMKLLFEQQKKLGNPHTDDEFFSTLVNALMECRPPLSGDDLIAQVGFCTLEPTERRSPKACYSSERFAWLTELNNIRLIGIDGQKRQLTETERLAIIELPYTQAKVNFDQLRQNLNLDESTKFNRVRLKKRQSLREAEEKTICFEAKYFHRTKKAYRNHKLEQQWESARCNIDLLDTIAYAMTVYKIDDEAVNYMLSKGISELEANAALDLNFTEFTKLSKRAIRTILPYLEQGLRYDEACLAAGYHHSPQAPEDMKLASIPKLEKDEIQNPVVYRAVNRAIKLINSVVKKFGPPKAVHIELSRELSKSFDERKEIKKQQDDYQQERQKDHARFVEVMEREPKRNELLKFRLYEQQCGRSPYSLKSIDISRICEVGYVEIDHILPISRSFDDSLSNKLLVLTKENRDKGNQIPYEYLNGATGTGLGWPEFRAWVTSTSSMPLNKKEKLLREEFNEQQSQQFKDRNLNDTRYIAVFLKNRIDTFLKFDNAHSKTNQSKCTVLSGRATNFFRNRWGLTKNRSEGDLHHALDAAVIAGCTPSMIKRVSDYSRLNELKDVDANFIDPITSNIVDKQKHLALVKHFPVPWPHFRDELIALLSDDPQTRLQEIEGYDHSRIPSVRPIRVSRSPKRLNTGEAHESKIRSIKHTQQTSDEIERGTSSIKTPLRDLKINIKKEDDVKNKVETYLKNVVGYDDPRQKDIIDQLRTRLIEFKGDGKMAFKDPIFRKAANGKQAPQIKSIKFKSVQKNGIMINGGIAKNGKMHCIDLYRSDGKYYAVPIYVSDLVKNKRPHYAAKHESPMGEQDYLFTIFTDEWIKIEKQDGTIIAGYYHRFDISTASITIMRHDRKPNCDGTNASGLYRGIGIMNLKSIKKYHIDTLGNIFK
ncbi:type II CRISPR RNA-guided endonuclease Cas9 [Vibrio campbellii]